MLDFCACSLLVVSVVFLLYLAFILLIGYLRETVKIDVIGFFSVFHMLSLGNFYMWVFSLINQHILQFKERIIVLQLLLGARRELNFSTDVYTILFGVLKLHFLSSFFFFFSSFNTDKQNTPLKPSSLTITLIFLFISIMFSTYSVNL